MRTINSNAKGEIESRDFMDFDPTGTSGGEYLYIIYNASLGNLSKIVGLSEPQALGDGGWFLQGTVSGFKVYRTTNKNTVASQYKVEF